MLNGEPVNYSILPDYSPTSTHAHTTTQSLPTHTVTHVHTQSHPPEAHPGLSRQGHLVRDRTHAYKALTTPDYLTTCRERESGRSRPVQWTHGKRRSQSRDTQTRHHRRHFEFTTRYPPHGLQTGATSARHSIASSYRHHQRGAPRPQPTSPTLLYRLQQAPPLPPRNPHTQPPGKKSQVTTLECRAVTRLLLGCRTLADLPA